jgi:electron transport complex protein RnfC
MGRVLPHDDIGIDKTSNCLLVFSAGETEGVGAEMPCIRCGDCATVCPARLLPQQLLFATRAGQWSQAEALGLDACIECGACDVVCPSTIALSRTFRDGRAMLRERAVRQHEADAARERYLQRKSRLQRDSEEEAARQETQRATQSASETVAAALARARAKKAGEPPR